jgi:hypothetical protein
MANLAPLTIIGSTLAVIGYFPELRRLVWVADAQPASQLLWCVWICAAALNFAYAWAVDAPTLLIYNYGAHFVMCSVSSLANLRLAWRLRRTPALQQLHTVLPEASQPPPARWAEAV